jgi:hypothetical protein
MMASGEFDCSTMAANGLLEMSILVILMKSARASSRIDWNLEEEDVACPVDDMKKSNCRRSYDFRLKMV